MKGCFATLLLCYFLPMHVFRYNEAVAQILSDFCNGPSTVHNSIEPFTSKDIFNESSVLSVMESK